jgi:hypothetical protein
MVKRTRLRPVSEKRRATFAARAECVRIVTERDRTCRFPVRLEAALMRSEVRKEDLACWGPLDVHEPIHRSQGADPTDPNQCELVCRGHHNWLHDHPVFAKILDL